MKNIESNQKPWFRLQNESSVAYSYFVTYRDLGPQRSYKKVQVQHKNKDSYIRQIEKWSRKYFWVYRASLYDESLDEKKLAYADEKVKALQDQAMDHANEVLESLLDIIRGRFCDPERLKAIELYLSGVGFIKKDPHLNKAIKDIPARQEAKLRKMEESIFGLRK